MRKRHWYAAEPYIVYVFHTKAARDNFVSKYPDTKTLSAVQVVKHIQAETAVRIKEGK